MKRLGLEALEDGMTCQVQSGDQVGGTEHAGGGGVRNPYPGAQQGSTHVCRMNACCSSGDGAAP